MASPLPGSFGSPVGTRPDESQVEAPRVSSGNRVLDFFDRLYIIHLPERTDRFKALKQELASIGIAVDGPKVRFMEGQWPKSANGFSSIGAYANFMSHLRILRQAKADGMRNIWIMEDDAIFRHVLRDPEVQRRLADRLSEGDWDLAYIGHKIPASRLKTLPRGLLVRFPSDEEFLWAHCYGISERALDHLLAYLEETLVNPPGDLRGGRMYIDGALNLFRRMHPHAVAMVSNPNLSSQRGSMSSLAQRKAYDKLSWLQPLVNHVRAARDELWRRGHLA